MNAQPDMTNFGQPPAAPSGMRRIAPLIKTAATGGFFLMIALYGLELTMPEHLKPGYILGEFVGRETIGHLKTSGDEEINYQTRLQTAQSTVVTTTTAMAGAVDMANTADQLCGWSRVGQRASGALRPQGYAAQQDSLAEMAFQFFGVLGGASCGVGTEIRNGMIGEMTSNGRRTGTLSVRDLQALPADQLKNVRQALMIDHASRHYTKEEYDHASNIWQRQPAEVQNALAANLNKDDPNAAHIFTERTLAYAAVVNLQ